MTKTQIFEFIGSRRSIGKLDLPAPSRDEIYQAIELAMTAPDHKQLKPWRFVVLDTPQDRAKFGEVLLQAESIQAQTTGQVLDDTAKAKFINMPNRAPVIIACISNYQDHPKVPEFEQMLSMGACIQNMLLAFLVMGYQSIWRSGLFMEYPQIKEFFKVDDRNQLCGFIYIGSSDVVMPKRELVNLDNFVSFIE